MERIEKTNVVMVYLIQQAEFALQKSYTIEVDQRNKNCYNYGEFRHLARNCRNRKTEGRIGRAGDWSIQETEIIDNKEQWRKETNRIRAVI